MNQTKIYFPLIFISLEDEPWEPIEPNPNASPEDDSDVAEQDLSQSDWTLASTETVTHEYLTQSGKVVRETITTSMDTTTLDFFYDESGRPFAFNYTPEGSTPNTYYYILNLQGDVVQIIDEGGVLQAEYVYSPWGKVISAEGDLAEINPLRYRGYYYDSETGFYYLQSRYYDPENHRFINADSYASTGQGFLGVNMFAYANNNPIIFGDAAGTVVDVVIAQYTETIPLEGATIHVTTEIVARYEIFDGTISLDDTSVSYSHDIYRDASGAVFTPLVNYNGEEPWYGLECTVADTTFSIDCNSIFSMSPREIHLYDNLYAKVRAEIEFDDTDPRGFSGVPVPAVYPESISSALATGFALGSAMMYYGTAGGGASKCVTSSILFVRSLRRVKIMKHNKKWILILLPLVIIIACIAGYPFYKNYRGFRRFSNYHFASVQDFLYQTQQKRPLSFHFLDEDVTNVAAGPYTLRVMSVQMEQGVRYLLALKESSGLGDSYRFFSTHADAAISYGGYADPSTGERVPYTDVAALFLEGGYLIQVLSDTPYTDTLNGPLYQAETDRIYAPNVSSCRYYQLFWIEGSMPTNYEIYSTGSDYSISYSALMREAKQLQEKLANKK